MKKLFSTLIFFFAANAHTWAQGCSVCTQTANQLGEKGAEGLNKGIVYLAMLPLTFIAVIGIIWWRNNGRLRS